MSARVTERTLYDYIGRIFGGFGWRCFSETELGEQFPDLIIEGDGTKVISEVKIDSEIQLTKAIIDADQKARKLGTRNAVALLFPSYIREMPLSELERNYARLRVSALVLTDWLAERKEMALEDLADVFTTSFKDWLETKKTRVSYDLVVEVARDSIREIAGYLRQSLSQKPVLDSAMAVVGRFDIYKSLLEDFSGVKEDEARLYIADITSYILVNQLLFYHIISERLGYDKLPDVDPINPSKDFLDVLERTLKKGREVYPHILGFDLFPVLRGDLRVVWSIARVVSTLKALRPQYIKEDLFGRLYHETIPPETRKNLGAFYTKPEAARLLAALAIDKWDAKVLDPACGSGTLLVEAYQRKAQLAPPMSREEMHEKFIGDIYGIDVMHFASHMTSMNLTAQNIEVPLKPHVMSQDGIITMVQSARESEEEDDPPKSAEQSITRWLEVMREERIPKDFDVVIMNPPFTRRERIPAKKEDLEKLVPEVKGKTGYWAYFVVAADKLLKENGSLAIVIPEEFFVGGGAESVREIILKKYTLQFVIRSGVEIAFSESALYRDYLVVFKRGIPSKHLDVIVLKRKLNELRGSIESIVRQIKNFAASLDYKFVADEFDAIKFSDADKLIERHISNLKPLVGFNVIEAQLLALELINDIKNNPTMWELRESKLIGLRLYRPGQYKIKGVESYAEKLFASKYGARSPNVTFIVDRSTDKKIRLRLKRRASTFFDIPSSATILSLRTYSGVRLMNLSSNEEFAIINPEVIPRHVLNLTGLIPFRKVSQAAEDIKKAHKDLAGNVLIARRIQLTSPGAYWLAFYSDERILGSQLPSISMKNKDYGKIFALYLNSIIALIQLLSFVAESRGSWASLDHDRVWSNIHVPRINKLHKRTLRRALTLFDKVGKVDVKPLFQRVRDHDPVQRSIDELALEMLGLDNWKPRLDEVYDAVAKELETMHKILETSRKPSKKSKITIEKEEKTETEKITKWLKE